jgi:hypothetical protein
MTPFYKIVVNEDDDTGVDFNAFVYHPAHMKNFIAFGKDSDNYSFNAEKRIVTGVMISVGTAIRRREEQFGEHYIVFDAPTVEMIRTKFFKHGFNQNLNEEHDPKKVIKGATLIDSYIASNSDPKLPSIPEAFAAMNLMDGTWIASYKIEDDNLWNDVKNGKFNGFSVEGLFEKVKINVKSKSNKMAEQKKTLLSAFKTMFDALIGSEDEQKFAQATTAEGAVVMYEGELEVGAILTIQSEGGQSMPAEEGIHQLTLEDGTVKIVTLDGLGAVVSVEDFQSEEAQTNTAEVIQLRSEVVELMTEFTKLNNDKFTKIEAENKALKAELTTIKTGEKFKANPKGGAAEEEEAPKKLTVAEIMKNAKK